MEIRWLGNSTFEVKSSTGVLVVDHQGGLPKASALQDENTVFAFSKGDYSARPATNQNVLSGPGEYEIGGLSVRGVATPADDPAISKEVNTVYIIDADGMQVATLGNPGHQPSAQSVQQISKVDVLIINTEAQVLEPDEMSTVIRSLEPKMIVPSGYDSESGKPSTAMSRLLTELGVKEFEPVPRLNVSRSGLPDERTVVVLQERPA
ncbi:MAG: MBL fold metallo-hydrolase [Dehalococcoidia bacterium]|jgi:L-ascorbate metabolism protein UlaG (beta-lactamase superfamily)|nr:MBL fold metallo-hydrolase [Dehalococcoidia bacterium]